MAIPTYDKLLDPLLELATTQPITRQSATEAIAKRFALTPDELSQRIPSGSSTVIRSRAGWAMTFLTKGRLIEKVAPKTYRATPKGIELRSLRPGGITLKDLEGLEGWEEAWRSDKKRSEPERDDSPRPVGVDTTTPAEALDAAVKTINADVKSRLMEAILAQSPTFFERLVLDVLVAMGMAGRAWMPQNTWARAGMRALTDESTKTRSASTRFSSRPSDTLPTASSTERRFRRSLAP